MSASKHSTFPALRVDGSVRHLAIVLGDQLDSGSRLVRETDKESDAILMMEVVGESEHVPSHKQRTALFLSAMRHFALDLYEKGYRLHYVRLDDRGNTQTFDGELERIAKRLKPEKLRCTEPGDWRVRDELDAAAGKLKLELEILPDEHFLTTRDTFEEWMAGRKQPVMEYFYREQRKRLDILMQKNGKPVGGAWNFDKENRKTFKRTPDVPATYTPRTDEITDEVLDLIEDRLPDLPGQIRPFRWAVTRDQARRALDDFIETRLPLFGDYEDAMWTDEPFLYHAVLSSVLNLKLLDPRECLRKALEAYDNGHAPINAVEGFVRQIIGWREFIRGIYLHAGPDYRNGNTFNEKGSLPEMYWTGETDMACMQQCLGQVLEHAYGHHIQRLMVTGNFALIAGINPQAISDWYLGMYVDAVDWVTLPNTLGMVMHADGGLVGTKPYAASGKYIGRMSNYCKGCRYDNDKRHGDDACPFTTFYWDFLLRHRRKLASNQRMSMILKNLDRMDDSEQRAIRRHAKQLRERFGI